MLLLDCCYCKLDSHDEPGCSGDSKSSSTALVEYWHPHCLENLFKDCDLVNRSNDEELFNNYESNS